MIFIGDNNTIDEVDKDNNEVSKVKFVVKKFKFWLSQ